MDKTPGQVACEAYYGINFPYDYSYNKEIWERIAAAVIAHVRPQIEAEARAAAFEDAAKKCDWLSKTGLYIAEEIRALASAPPDHVCVPIEFIERVNDCITALRSRGEHHVEDRKQAIDIIEETKAVLAARQK